MKISKKSISSTSYTSAASAYGKAQRVTGSEPVSDSVEVSESGNLFQAAQNAASQVPDIRTEAIEGIQNELANGNYQRDEHEVADKMVTDHLSSPLPAF